MLFKKAFTSRVSVVLIILALLAVTDSLALHGRSAAAQVGADAEPYPGSQLDGRAADAVARVVERLEPVIREAMEEGHLPSITVALTDRVGELWAGAYGESNLWAGTEATTETVYLIGSTFKAQSTIALLQQMERGLFQLDDPVNPYLSEFLIRGEEPGFPVTFRHLLTHTSGLPAAYGGHDVWGETVPAPLPEYLGRSLVVERRPMERVVYSNLAYTLVGYLVERFSGIPYKEYIQERIWAPIGMHDTAFQPTPEMEERLSIPYAPDRQTGRLAPAGRTKADVWPAGIVYGTVHDQASWVRFNLGDGAVEGGRLLQPETMDLMHSLQFRQFSGGSMGGGWGYENAGYGLTWWTSTRDGESFFAHSGSVSGYTAFVMGNRSRGFGIAVLTNGNRAHPHLVRICNLAVDLLAEELGESR
jgi:CubicO group peptidase (beta-lactamase class C family)